MRDRSDQLIADSHAQKEKWKEHFSDLLNSSQGEADISDVENVTAQPSFDFLTNTDEAPARNEVVVALKKSPEVDDIINEQLNCGELGLVDKLVSLFKTVWEEEQIPEDWSNGVIVVIGKKGDTSHCSNNRGITLRSTTSKLLQIILSKRLNDGWEKLLRENQSVFRQNRSCVVYRSNLFPPLYYTSLYSHIIFYCT